MKRFKEGQYVHWVGEDQKPFNTYGIVESVVDGVVKIRTYDDFRVYKIDADDSDNISIAKKSSFDIYIRGMIAEYRMLIEVERQRYEDGVARNLGVINKYEQLIK